MTQDLHQQPGAVTARSEGPLEGLVRALHTRFHADRVGDRAKDPTVELDQEVDDGLVARPWRARVAAPLLQPLRQQRAGFVVSQVRRQLAAQPGVVDERIARRLFVDEEVERVDGGEVGDEIDRHGEQAGRLGEHQTRHVVAERVLLPVDEVLVGFDGQRVGEDRCAAMRSRPHAHDVRRQTDGPVEPVADAVLQRDLDAHAGRSRVEFEGSIWK